MGHKVSGFAGCCHHLLATMSTHIKQNHYLLLESGMKTSLQIIALCTKDIALLCKHEEQQWST